MLGTPPFTLRAWKASDKDSLILHVNNYKVWINLVDRVPHPYIAADADNWLALSAAVEAKVATFAIDLEGSAVGCIGFRFLDDVNRLTAEIGYWLGEPFWGKGIATAALKKVTAYAFANFALERLQAHVFAWNPASARVLEKAGYTLEGRLHRNIVKDGRIGDSLLYAKLRGE